MPNRLRRKFTVYRREIWIRLKAFRTFIVIFLIAALLGAIFLMKEFELSFLRALYEAVSLMFFSSSIDFPEGKLFYEIMWILFPLIGLILLADGLAGIGLAIKFGDPTSKLWNEEVSKIMEEHYVMVGIGNVGFKVLKELIDKEYEVVVIDKSDAKGREGEFQDFQKDNRIPFIRGDASQENILESANLVKAKGLFVLINDDLLNLKIAVLARTINPEIKLILRMFDLKFAEKVQESLSIDHIISTSSIAAPSFVSAIED